jgi:D-lactate dehydrogenase (cytochrome)
MAMLHDVKLRNSAAQAIAELRPLLGDRLSTAEAVRAQHGKDLTWDPGAPPDAVAFVESTEDVQEIVKVALRYEVPIIPYGTGTSLEGHISAPFGGISMDLSRMNRVLDIHPDDLDARVEAGVTRKQLNAALREHGLFFPIDPGADASLGGMAATRASGTNAVRYGTMRENVLNLTAVMATGEVLHTARRAKKSSAGYDLTRLLIGSEGTLGIITEVTLRLQGIPESILSGYCAFPDIASACNATILTIQSGIPIARIELLDALQIRAANAYSKLSLPELPHLFLEFHGTEAGAREQVGLFADIAGELGGGGLEWAVREEDRSRLWQARHDAFWAAKSLMPGKDAFATDVCVPISRLAECVVETQRDMEESGLFGPIVGHVGDGNFHVQLFCDVHDDEEVARCRAFYDRLVRRALAMEGTSTGEHGIGRGKMKFMEAEHGAVGVELMRLIKRTLDPSNIMNPGKLVPL